MEVITYLLGIELVRIEHRIQGRDAGFQVLITHSNCIQQFFVFLEFVDIFGCLSFQEDFRTLLLSQIGSEGVLPSRPAGD